jgi:hypothetical protein
MASSQARGQMVILPGWTSRTTLCHLPVYSPGCARLFLSITESLLPEENGSNPFIASNLISSNYPKRLINPHKFTNWLRPPYHNQTRDITPRRPRESKKSESGYVPYSSSFDGLVFFHENCPAQSRPAPIRLTVLDCPPLFRPAPVNKSERGRLPPLRCQPKKP